MIAQYIRMGAALGVGIVIGISAMLALEEPRPRCRPCPQPSFHHAAPR